MILTVINADLLFLLPGCLELDLLLAGGVDRVLLHLPAAELVQEPVQTQAAGGQGVIRLVLDFFPQFLNGLFM